MRTTGPEWSGSLYPYPNEGMDPPIKLVRYAMTAIASPMRMIQQTMIPAVVAVSDVKFLIVITSTTMAMMNNNINSYMYDRRV